MQDNYEIFAGISDDMPEAELAVFQRVFLSDEGQFALGCILDECKFMRPCENEGDMALNNLAKKIMATIYCDRNTKRIQMYHIIEYIKKRFKRRSHA